MGSWKITILEMPMRSAATKKMTLRFLALARRAGIATPPMPTATMFTAPMFPAKAGSLVRATRPEVR